LESTLLATSTTGLRLLRSISATWSSRSGGAVHGIDDKEDDIGLLYGELHLAVDLGLKHIVAVDHPSAGIDD